MSLTASCRFCESPLTQVFVDLGSTPLANSYLTPDDLYRMEPFFPLCAFVCDACRLVQLVHDVAPHDLFRDYAYFSSYSDTWLAHAETYTQSIVGQMPLNKLSLVVEIAGNDGYLLKCFKSRSIPVLNIEPAANVATVAEESGIPTVNEFFCVSLAQHLVNEGRSADLLIGNNVLAHVPDINDFVVGMKTLLKPGGVITMEFPHLLALMEGNQFDTIYHEHFSYLSLLVVTKIFSSHGLKIFDVEKLTTHGGSLRIFAGHLNDTAKSVCDTVGSVLDEEKTAGLRDAAAYEAFSEKVKETKRKILEMLIRIKDDGKSIVGYGAPAKGNTLLNYCGIGTDFLDYTVDRSPHKQGLYLPGTRIPIYSPAKLSETKPDYVLILPWNIRAEIMNQISHIREWGGQFMVPIPEPEVF